MFEVLDYVRLYFWTYAIFSSWQCPVYRCSRGIDSWNLHNTPNARSQAMNRWYETIVTYSISHRCLFRVFNNLKNNHLPFMSKKDSLSTRNSLQKVLAPRNSNVSKWGIPYFVFIGRMFAYFYINEKFWHWKNVSGDRWKIAGSHSAPLTFWSFFDIYTIAFWRRSYNSRRFYGETRKGVCIPRKFCPHLDFAFERFI